MIPYISLIIDFIANVIQTLNYQKLGAYDVSEIQ